MEEYRKRKKKRRKSQDIEILETSPYVNDDETISVGSPGTELEFAL